MSIIPSLHLKKVFNENFVTNIRKENIKEVIGTIAKSMGSTLAACGDVNRNVMAPAAPYEKGSYPAARKLANDIADLLSPQKSRENIP